MQKNTSSELQKNFSACSSHDHQHCIDVALAQAKKICKQSGARLTPLRLRVLALVWQSHQPLGAYEILAQLSEQDGRPAAPPRVYRALNFLLEQGLTHRIASLNAFIGCGYPHLAHEGHFLICRQCHYAHELPYNSIDHAIAAEAQVLGFAVETQTVEVMGLCASCQKT